ELVDQGWQRDPPGLRKHNADERADASQPETSRRLALAGVDRLDRRAIDLGHVGAVEQGERHDTRRDRVEVEANRRRDAEIHEEDVDIKRERAEDLNVEKP